jgi:hypothetical protein
MHAKKIPLRKVAGEKHANAEMPVRASKSFRRPKMTTGHKLRALRSQMVAQGGELLDGDGITAELRHHRGGLT